MRLGSPAGAGVAGAALAAVLLTTSCTDRTELRRSADEPTTDPRPPSSAPAPDTAGHVTPVPEPSPRVLFADRDVASEGVRPVHAGPQLPVVQGRLPGCLRGALADAEPASGKLAAAWRYPTGSVLAQYAAGYPADAVRRLLGETAGCGKPLPTPPAATARQVRWCEPNLPGTVSCSAMLSDGQRLSLVTVRSREPDRAAQAIDRLAPLAAEKLGDS